MPQHLIHQRIPVHPHTRAVGNNIVFPEQRDIIRSYVLGMRAGDPAVVITGLADSLRHRDNGLRRNISDRMHVDVEPGLRSLETCLGRQRLVHQRLYHRSVLRIRLAQRRRTAFHRSVIYYLQEIHPEPVIIVFFPGFHQSIYPAVDNRRILHMTRAAHESLQISAAFPHGIQRLVILLFEVIEHPHISGARNPHCGIVRGILLHYPHYAVPVKEVDSSQDHRLRSAFHYMS